MKSPLSSLAIIRRGEGNICADGEVVSEADIDVVSEIKSLLSCRNYDTLIVEISQAKIVLDSVTSS